MKSCTSILPPDEKKDEHHLKINVFKSTEKKHVYNILGFVLNESFSPILNVKILCYNF